MHPSRESIARRSLVAAVSFTLLAACTTTHIVPAEHAHLVDARGTAVIARNAGIEVVADADAWSGSPEVLDRLVAIRLSITNRSTQSAYVSPTDVELRTSNQVQRAEPLERVAPRPLRTTLGMDPTEFDGRSAVLSDQANIRSKAAQLRDEAVERGLRAQRIEPGRTATGFAYFERTPWDEGKIELRIVLRSDVRGEVLTTVSLPFAAIS